MMPTRIRIGLALLLAMLAVPASARAQGTSAASISGTVTDTSGGVLPGVTVEAASPALIEKVRSTVTDANGQYRILELRPGTYSITFTLPGFNILKREGVELRPSFTAQIDVELNVGDLAETIVVSGAGPLVDVQNVTQQTTVTKDLLDAVPTSKSMLGIAALIPAVVEPPNAQDVGGSKGERSVRISVHGGKTFDSRLLQDGMRYNALTPGIGGLEGTGRGYYVNPLAVQEVIIDVGTMGSAEYSLGGAQINSIPRNGGNRFTGSLFVSGTGHRLQSDNLTDELRAAGLNSVNTVRAVFDFNGALGGPVLRDRIWFFSSGRRWGTETSAANLYHDANTTDFVYTPDLSRPVYPKERNMGGGGRITVQATQKDKFTFSYDRQRNRQDQLTGQLETGTTKYESLAGYCQRHAVTQGTWTRTQSNAVLFDAGMTISRFNFAQFGEDLFLSDVQQCGGGLLNNVSINDTGLGYTYNGVGNKTLSLSHQTNGRFNVSIVKASHTIKTGVFWMYGLGGGHRTYSLRSVDQVNGLPVSYTFNRGTPTGITVFASPIHTIDQLNPDLGIYVQDRFEVGRVTISAGLRFDWLRETAKATSVPEGVAGLVPARSYPEITNVPNWKDLSPRLGIVWDPRGDGRTAIKAGINRYVQSNTTGIAQLFDQAAAAVNSTTRSWNDLDGDFIPDCDLANRAENLECGAMANQAFGTFVQVNTPDPEWITGWGKRGYNWQASVSVERELVSNVMVSAGYYRTWFGNFMATDNLRLEPSDFQSYCVTAPTDARLPSGISGAELCGFADVVPTKFGQVSNLVTQASKYGKQIEIYNGADVNFQIRLRDTLNVGGGWNIGNSVQTSTNAGGNASSRTNNCFVIDSPQQAHWQAVGGALSNCDVKIPYQSRVRLNGSYSLPYDVQIAAVFQSNPGPSYNANVTYTTAQIQQSLGRPLAGGTRTVVINVLPQFSEYGPRIYQFDLRGSKIIRFGTARLQANIDLYNAFNSSAAVNLNNTFNANWLQPTQILDARLLKFSLQYDF